MKNRSLFIVLVLMTLCYSAINAQQNNVKDMIMNPKTRNEIMDQMLANHNIMIELMNKILDIIPRHLFNRAIITTLIELGRVVAHHFFPLALGYFRGLHVKFFGQCHLMLFLIKRMSGFIGRAS